MIDKVAITLGWTVICLMLFVLIVQVANFYLGLGG